MFQSQAPNHSTLAQVSKEEAERRIKELGETYKLEILDGIVQRHPESTITIYHVGDESSEHRWWDLCAGPHVERTGEINPEALALESVAGMQAVCALGMMTNRWDGCEQQRIKDGSPSQRDQLLALCKRASGLLARTAGSCLRLLKPRGMRVACLLNS